MNKSILLVILMTLSSLTIFAQMPKANISGSIVDNANNETLIGASVKIEGTNIVAISDIDGNYNLLNLVPGKYNLVVSYLGMATQTIKDVFAESGKTTKIDIKMGADPQILSEVVVKTVVQKRSVGSLLLLQQKSPSFVTGITSDEMRKSPDRTTSDVLKRVSGTSIQDNKFVVIRGLADRYNTALINGLALPSTEPDKKAFSFDIFPSNLLDNLIIYKTATPDLPGEFAGGVIVMNTKEIPEEGFTTFNIGTTYNAQTTFKRFDQSEVRGSTDWLGFDDGSRDLPAAFPKSLENDDQAFAYSKSVQNDWGVKSIASMRPAQNYQLSFGRRKDILGRDFGVIGAVTYNNTPKVQFNDRNDFNVDKSQTIAYKDVINKENISLGAMLNFAFHINPLNKIQFNNVYTSNIDNQFVLREGNQFEQERLDRSYNFFYMRTGLASTQIIGEHAQKEGKLKAKWSLGYNQVRRSIPSYRRALYQKYLGNEDSNFELYIPPGSPSPNYAGRFYGNQLESNLTGGVDFTLPYMTRKNRNNLKFGGSFDLRDRNFSARVLGYSGFLSAEDKSKPLTEALDARNIREGGVKLIESTQRADGYDAGSVLGAGYAMVEQYLGSKTRLTTGVRFEGYNQNLNSFKINSNTPVVVDTTFLDWLPSINVFHSLNENSNLRFSLSKTVARPNFRELAPFGFYDFLLDASILGNPELVRTQIYNADVKYEIFPGENQLIAFSAFYKYFINPIEQIYNNSQGAGTRTFLFQNAPSAQNIGAELEVRFKGSSIFKNSNLAKDFLLFSNLAYIYTEVDQSQLPGAISRGLQGQSPYIINAGLTYAKNEKGFSSTILVNRIGRRIWAVGQDQYKHTFEGPRTVLDFQVTQRVWKKGEIKLNVSDILNQTLNFYQDQNENGRYDKDEDTKIISSRFGQNISLAFTYTF